MAAHSAAVLPYLARHYEVDVVVDGITSADDRVFANCSVRTVDEFLLEAARYDRIVYQFGNSPCHQHMFGLVKALPGLVVLHDFFLSRARFATHKQDHAALAQALYDCHGYPSLQTLQKPSGDALAVWNYPLNLDVLQHALGVVVHSRHAIGLTEEWHGSDALARMTLAPLAHRPVPAADRATARRALGFETRDLVVCAFGFLGPNKLNHRLVEAWLGSPLRNHPRAYLLFVGGGLGDHYEKALKRLVDRSSAGDRIRFTGWIDDDLFGRHLAAADIAVQLRALSRGETCLTALDAMASGVATVVNAHGSLAELDAQSVRVLRDGFSRRELADALLALATNPAHRQHLGASARELVLGQHGMQAYADRLHHCIEAAYGASAPAPEHASTTSASVYRRWFDEAPPTLGMTLTRPPKPRVRRWLVDVSELVREDARTGIHRVTRAILLEWLRSPPPGYRVEPIYATAVANGYRHARRLACEFLELPADWAHDDPVEVSAGDVFVGLDWSLDPVHQNRGTLHAWHARGTKVWFVVYDLLPITLPHCFPPDMPNRQQRWMEAVSAFDGVACISEAVADDVRHWLVSNQLESATPLAVTSFPLGADLAESQATLGLPDDAAKVLAAIGARPSFLMVGTVEPRKGHAQALSAFELLWARGVDVNLVVVGRRGWMVDEVLSRLDTHGELGRRLIWLTGISDEYLEKIYAAGTCLLAASINEGFGLPLIEAAKHRLPIIARDIPVFREVAGPHAAYFTGNSALQLADSLSRWLAMYRLGTHPSSGSTVWSTWKTAARRLAEVISENVLEEQTASRSELAKTSGA